MASEVKSEHCPASGVKVMSISGRTIYEKERLAGMSEDDRAWRRKWLKDQQLTAREPQLISKTSPALMNPIRRFYRKPLDILFFKLLQPVIGETRAYVGRYYTGRVLMGVWISYLTFYYFKYNMNTWEKKGSWRAITSRKVVLPGDAGYPKVQDKSIGSDYCDRGFKDSIFAVKVEDCTPKKKSC